MNDSSKPITKTSKTETLVGVLICIGIVTLALILFMYIPLLDKAQKEKEQTIYESLFTIHSTYHGYLGNYEADARMLPDMPHSTTHTYDWLIQFKGGTHYFQQGNEPIVPSKEELCKAKLSETDDCMDRMNLEKLK